MYLFDGMPRIIGDHLEDPVERLVQLIDCRLIVGAGLFDVSKHPYEVALHSSEDQEVFTLDRYRPHPPNRGDATGCDIATGAEPEPGRSASPATTAMEAT